MVDFILYVSQSEGRSFVCGKNDCGQLGVGDERDRDRLTEINLTHLNLVPGDKIIQAYVGIDITVFLTEQGRCFACGKNDYGKLGIGDNESKNRPTEISFAHLNLVAGDKIKQIFIGHDHSIYITEKGRYLACGMNNEGQLGVGDNDNKNRPTEISFAHLNLAPDDKIKQVFCTFNYTMYLTEQGRCFACGANYFGGLGIGDDDNKNRLTEISFAHLNLASDDKIKKVYCGFDYSIYLTEQGRCFACGVQFYLPVKRR